MAFTTNSIYMSLPVPDVGQEPGPQYASDVNSCFTIVDQHSHLPGSGVLIVSDAININADLPFNDNNLTGARALRFQAQPSPIPATGLDLGELYEAGVDLWYNDGAGNQIRLTASGAVAGTPGSISNLTPPASASYSAISETFIFNSAATTPANIQGASINLGDLTPGTNYVTLSPPTPITSAYTITLPQLPGSTLPLSISAAGVMTAGQITTAQIANGAVTNAQIASQTIMQGNLALRSTGTTVGAGGVAISNSSGMFSNFTTGFVNVTNLSVTITTTGRPVMISLQPDGTGNQAYLLGATSSGSGALQCQIQRDGTTISDSVLGLLTNGSGEQEIQSLPGAVSFIDIITAGTYTYTLQIASGSGASPVAQVFYCVLTAYEL